MITTKDGFSCNILKLESYLKTYKIDYDSLIITISKGGNTFDILGNTDGINKINIYYPSWIPNKLKELAISKIILHEYAHICGIKKCESSFFTRIRCIMYENKSWQKEMVILPLQLLSGINFCDKCKKIVYK